MEKIEKPEFIGNINLNIPLHDFVGKKIRVKGKITNVEESFSEIAEAIFECNACLERVNVKQTSNTHMREPALCPNCGGRLFTLLTNNSTYSDLQYAELSSEKYHNGKPSKIKLLFINKFLDFVKINDNVELVGVLKTFEVEVGVFIYIIVVENIKIMDKSIIEEPVINENNRNSKEYNDWRKQIISRDGQCVCCGLDKHLEAHHIWGYKNNPDLRVEEDNGIVLCTFCHNKFHSIYGKNATPVDLVKFICKYGNGGYNG